MAYTSRYDNVFFVSYLWDDDPVDAPTARMESTVSKITCVARARRGKDSEGSLIIVTVCE